jgi:hypothetical protein
MLSGYSQLIWPVLTECGPEAIDILSQCGPKSADVIGSARLCSQAATTTPNAAGKCFCGAVRFQLSEPPLMIRSCWCRDCQYFPSGNASIHAIFRWDVLRVAGDFSEFISISDAGNKMSRRFCKECGTPLFGEFLETPNFILARVGALDDREVGQPMSVIWTASAPSWAFVHEDVPSCAGRPGPVVTSA